MGNHNSGAKPFTESMAITEGWYQPNEYSGYCHCGCGHKTTISPSSNRQLGYLKGTPRRFCQGHGQRKFPHGETEEVKQARKTQYHHHYKDDPVVRQRIADQQHRWYLDHREEILRDPKKRTQRRQSNLDWRSRLYRQFVESVDPQILLTIHDRLCGICQQRIDDDFHVDHIIPLSHGGTHGYVNCQPAHPLCNMRKGNRV